MKTTDFNELTLFDKRWLVSEFAAPLLSMEYYDHRIFLFSLNNDFVEMYQNIDTQEIEQISIPAYKALDKYLSRILIGSIKTKRQIG